MHTSLICIIIPYSTYLLLINIFLSFSMIFLATLWLFSNSEEDTDNFHIIYNHYTRNWHDNTFKY